MIRDRLAHSKLSDEECENYISELHHGCWDFVFKIICDSQYDSEFWTVSLPNNLGTKRFVPVPCLWFADFSEGQENCSMSSSTVECMPWPRNANSATMQCQNVALTKDEY